jgi:chromosome partitioning protein
MAQVISIVNQKGGVGKTTTSINVAALLAEKGKFVLLVDMDPQGNATTGLGINKAELEKGIYDILVGNIEGREGVYRTAYEGLDIAPATMDLAGATIELVNVEDREFILQKALSEIRTHYDYIIIDCPPSLGLLTINCLIACDHILIPVQSEYFALEGLGQLMQTIDLIKNNIKQDVSVLGAVLTMYDRRNTLAWQVRNELLDHFPYTVFNSVIPRNVRLTEAPSHGEPISSYDPYSKGGRAYVRLVDEMIELLEKQTNLL